MRRSAKSSLPSERLLRIRALSNELDAQRQFAIDRGKTQETKASFVLVVVGLVASISSAQLTDTPFWPVGLLPIAVALLSAVMAVLVLWPRQINVVDAESLVLRWVDSCESQESLEDYLLESKKDEIKARDAKYENATPHLKWAFRLLLTSVAVLFIVAIVNGLIPVTSATPSISPTPGVTP